MWHRSWKLQARQSGGGFSIYQLGVTTDSPQPCLLNHTFTYPPQSCPNCVQKAVSLSTGSVNRICERKLNVFPNANSPFHVAKKLHKSGNCQMFQSGENIFHLRFYLSQFVNPKVRTSENLLNNYTPISSGVPKDDKLNLQWRTQGAHCRIFPCPTILHNFLSREAAWLQKRYEKSTVDIKQTYSHKQCVFLLCYTPSEDDTIKTLCSFLLEKSFLRW